MTGKLRPWQPHLGKILRTPYRNVFLNRNAKQATKFNKPSRKAKTSQSADDGEGDDLQGTLQISTTKNKQNTTSCNKNHHKEMIFSPCLVVSRSLYECETMYIIIPFENDWQIFAHHQYKWSSLKTSCRLNLPIRGRDFPKTDC